MMKKSLYLLLLLMLPATIMAANRYVARAGQTPAEPYTSWATAASNIQTAVSVAADGDFIWVGPGNYRRISGSQVVNLDRYVRLRGVGDPSEIVIDGNNAYRGIYSTTQRIDIDGFTVANGFHSDRGGGLALYSVTAGSVIRNCIIENNSGGARGGGMVINSGSGNDILIENTIIRGNQAGNGGGVCVYESNNLIVFRNCLVSHNVASSSSGGIVPWHNGPTVIIENSTIVSNTAVGSTDGGGGLRRVSGTLIVSNSIVYHNTAPAASAARQNYNGTITWRYSCTTPAVSGEGNTDLDPGFLDPDNGNFRLTADSPCIDAGRNHDWMDTGIDLDGYPRVTHGTVDMGCYEHPFFGWDYAPVGAITNTAMHGAYRVTPLDLVQTGAYHQDMTVRLVSTNAWLQAAADVAVPPSNILYIAQITNSAVGTPPGQYFGDLSLEVANPDLANYDFVLTNTVAFDFRVLELTTSASSLSNSAMAGHAPSDMPLDIISAGVGAFDYTIDRCRALADGFTRRRVFDR